MRDCLNGFTALIVVNILLWSMTVLAVFHIALRLSGSPLVAWIAMLITLGSGEPGYYAHTYLAENVAAPAFVCFMLFGMRAIETGRAVHGTFAGAAVGLAVLARPAYLYSFYLLAPLVVTAAVLMKARTRTPSLRSAIAFVGCTVAIVAPWMIRNVWQFGDPAPSKGYAELVLIHRLSYNQMSWAEWGVSWIYWLPDFGDELAQRLFAPQLWERLGWNHPMSYYLDGASGAFYQSILQEARSDSAVMPLLMRQYLLGDIFKHVMVSLPLSMRGMGLANYLSVAGVLLFWPVARAMRATGKLLPFLCDRVAADVNGGPPWLRLRQYPAIQPAVAGSLLIHHRLRIERRRSPPLWCCKRVLSS